MKFSHFSTCVSETYITETPVKCNKIIGPLRFHLSRFDCIWFCRPSVTNSTNENEKILKSLKVLYFVFSWLFLKIFTKLYLHYYSRNFLDNLKVCSSIDIQRLSRNTIEFLLEVSGSWSCSAFQDGQNSVWTPLSDNFRAIYTLTIWLTKDCYYW